ncbi:MAG: hypothetical protein ACP5RN_07355 [Armatimonadota bacterium]
MALFQNFAPASDVVGEDTCRLETKYASRLREEPYLARWVSYAGNRDVLTRSEVREELFELLGI